MKKYLLILLLALTACSQSGYDRERATELCNIASERELSPEETAEMIEQDRILLQEQQDRLNSLLDETDSQDFDDAFLEAMADTAFVARVEMGERMWRILVRNRPNLTESNLPLYNQLYELQLIVDLLNDDLNQRLD